jgi:hypothetical protein
MLLSKHKPYSDPSDFIFLQKTPYPLSDPQAGSRDHRHRYKMLLLALDLFKPPRQRQSDMILVRHPTFLEMFQNSHQFNL